jgi:dihydrofolate reductase
MAKLQYSVLMSLDGYVEDKDGNFDWAAPDDEVHAFVNDLERPVGTYLYGRRMYETMVAWETMSVGVDAPGVVRDFAQLWRAADKVVYSRTLDGVGSERTRIERDAHPAAIGQLKATAERDLSVGGAELAAHAIRAGLVDEIRLLVNPVIVGAGKSALPAMRAPRSSCSTSGGSETASSTCDTASPCLSVHGCIVAERVAASCSRALRPRSPWWLSRSPWRGRARSTRAAQRSFTSR